MSIQDIIKIYDQLQKDISKHFGIRQEVLEINRSEWWFLNQMNDQLVSGYSDIEKDIDENSIYSGDVIRNFIVRKDTHTLVYYDTGCGDKAYLVLDNSKEIKDEVLIEKVNDLV